MVAGVNSVVLLTSREAHSVGSKGAHLTTPSGAIPHARENKAFMHKISAQLSRESLKDRTSGADLYIRSVVSRNLLVLFNTRHKANTDSIFHFQQFVYKAKRTDRRAIHTVIVYNIYINI